MTKIKLARMDPELVSREIGDFIIQEITSIGKTGGVIGLSGGVDSTCAAALAKKAFDRYNSENPKVKLELVGYMLPTKLNPEADTSDGEKVAKRLGIRYEILSIEQDVQGFQTTNPETLKSKYHKGNLISTIRAAVLQAKAAYENKLLIGTGNRDEDFGVAYYTLFGDGAVHLSPLGNLSKRLVKQMACYLGFKDLAFRISSPGLEPGQTSFGDLGYNYDPTIEIVTSGLEQGLTLDELVKNEQVIQTCEIDINEYEKSFGKRKFETTEEIVKDIIRRNKIARKKSSILHPPVAPINLEYE